MPTNQKKSEKAISSGLEESKNNNKAKEIKSTNQETDTCSKDIDETPQANSKKLMLKEDSVPNIDHETKSNSNQLKIDTCSKKVDLEDNIVISFQTTAKHKTFVLDDENKVISEFNDKMKKEDCWVPIESKFEPGKCQGGVYIDGNIYMANEKNNSFAYIIQSFRIGDLQEDFSKSQNNSSATDTQQKIQITQKYNTNVYIKGDVSLGSSIQYPEKYDLKLYPAKNVEIFCVGCISEGHDKPNPLNLVREEEIIPSENPHMRIDPLLENTNGNLLGHCFDSTKDIPGNILYKGSRIWCLCNKKGEGEGASGHLLLFLENSEEIIKFIQLMEIYHLDDYKGLINYINNRYQEDSKRWKGLMKEKSEPVEFGECTIEKMPKKMNPTTFSGSLQLRTENDRRVDVFIELNIKVNEEYEKEMRKKLELKLTAIKKISGQEVVFKAQHGVYYLKVSFRH